MKRTRILLLALAAILWIGAGARAATNVLVTAGVLRDGSGNALPDGALVALVVNPTGSTFGAPSAGASVMAGSTVGGGVVVATWAVDSTRAGFAGGAFNIVSFNYAALGNGLASGQAMALYWFPASTLSNPVVANGASYGVYTNSAVAARSTMAWVSPDDTAAANQELGLLTTDAGGTVAIATAEASANAGTPVYPSISVQPQSQTLTAPGGSVTFSITASGSPAPTFIWLHNGAPLSGVTGSTYTIASVQPSDVGNYLVIVTNSLGSYGSSPFTLNIDQAGNAATQLPTGAPTGYVAGQTQTFTNTVTYTGSATALSWSLLIPYGWTYVSDTAGADTSPTVGQFSELEWTWNKAPPSPFTFTYTLTAGPSVFGSSQFTSLVGLNNGTTLQFLAQADPMTLTPVTFHSADVNQDLKIQLAELTRVIELYNTHNGTTRTGAYTLQSGTEDGFAPDTTRTSSQTLTLPYYHSADVNQDAKISLTELTRVIELYNYHSGTSRTGQYHAQAGTEDDFAPGP